MVEVVDAVVADSQRTAEGSVAFLLISKSDPDIGNKQIWLVLRRAVVQVWRCGRVHYVTRSKREVRPVVHTQSCRVVVCRTDVTTQRVLHTSHRLYAGAASGSGSTNHERLFDSSNHRHHLGSWRMDLLDKFFWITQCKARISWSCSDSLEWGKVTLWPDCPWGTTRPCCLEAWQETCLWAQEGRPARKADC